MFDVNVKDLLEKKAEDSARNINESNHDSFIKLRSYDPDEAYRRLSVVSNTIRQFEYDIAMAGTRTIPTATIELYETAKLVLREIENAEMNTIKTGTLGQEE